MDLRVLEGVGEWHARNTCALFPNLTSVVWFIKMHRNELVERGVLLRGRGRAGSLVDGERFGHVALEIVRRERGGLEESEASAA